MNAAAPDPGGVSRRRAVVVVGVVLLLLLGIGVAVGLGSDENRSGTGFDFRGEFHQLSGAEVLPERLGSVLDRGVAFQDTTTDVRLITGVDPATALAAWVRNVGGTPSEGGAAWLLVSPDPALAADPWSDENLAAALLPPR